VHYNGTWFPNGSPAHSGGSSTLAMDDGAKASFTFTGTEVSWIGYRDEWSGIARVYVDGTLKGSVDTFSSTSQAKVTLFTIDNLSSGEHTTAVEATGQKSASSQGVWIWIDAFDYSSSTAISAPASSGSTVTSSGNSINTQVGYATVVSTAAAPAGLAVFSFRQNGVVISEASVPASVPMKKGRIASELTTTVNTGLALANSGNLSATVDFYFTDANGNNWFGCRQHRFDPARRCRSTSGPPCLRRLRGDNLRKTSG
jgi:hypothetical protein